MFLIGFVLILFSCGTKKQVTEYIKIVGKAQGSTYLVSYENTVGRDLSNEIDSLLTLIDKSLSIYNPNSTISRINQNDTNVQVDILLQNVLQKSFKVWEESNGYFDLTVGPLVKAWGFGPKANEDKSKRIDTLMKYVGMDKIKVSKNKIIKAYPLIFIDVNAIAQGFTVDFICNYLDSLEIENYLVEIGGEIKAKGNNSKGGPWKIGIDKPIENNGAEVREIQAIISIKNKALATSGNYRKFYIENGIKYSHTIDPFTGYPAKNTLLSASIINNDCALADAYATACMAMGIEKAKSFIENNKELDAYFIYSAKDGSLLEYSTPGFRKLFNTIAK